MSTAPTMRRRRLRSSRSGRFARSEQLEKRLLLAADLSIEKTATQLISGVETEVDSALIGTVLNYNITVSNNADALPENVSDEITLTDVLPEGVRVLSITSSQGTLSLENGEISGSLGTLAGGETATIVIAVAPTLENTSLSNTATISTDDASEADDLSASVEVDVPNSPNSAVRLQVIKEDTPDEVAPGEAITYTLTVRNRSKVDAENVVVYDQLPDGVTLISAEAEDGEVTIGADGLITFDLGTLEARTQTKITLVVMADEPGEVANVAIATTSSGVNFPGKSGFIDPDDSDATDKDRGNVGRSLTLVTEAPADAADLELTKTTDVVGSVLPGQLITYTLTVENTSANEATNVILTDLLSSGAVVVSASSDTEGVELNTVGGLTVASLGDIDAGETVVITVQALALTAGTIENTALVTTPSGDSDLSDNLATATVTVDAAPATGTIDLQIEKTDTPDPAERDGTVTYTITVTNVAVDESNPVTAENVIVVDRLPAGATFVSASGVDDVTEVDGVITANIGSLEAGESVVITVEVLAGAQLLRNRAFVSSTTADVDTSNNVVVTSTSVDGFEDDCFVGHAFEKLLERVKDPEGGQFWLEKVQNGVARGVVARALAESEEFFASIVRPAYLDYLGREADDGGLNFWVQQMRNGLTEAELQALFIGSDEFFQTAGGTNAAWVEAMYEALLNRESDAGGSAHWQGRLAAGDSRANVAFGFTNSNERAKERVEDFYTRYLDRAAGEGEVSFWAEQLRNGADIQDVIAGFLASDEFFANCLDDDEGDSDT